MTYVQLSQGSFQVVYPLGLWSRFSGLCMSSNCSCKWVICMSSLRTQANNVTPSQLVLLGGARRLELCPCNTITACPLWPWSAPHIPATVLAVYMYTSKTYNDTDR